MPRERDPQFDTFEEEVAYYERRQQAARDDIRRAFSRSPAVIVTDDGHRELWILSGNPSGPGERITFLLPDGPRGHDEGTRDELFDRNASYYKLFEPADDGQVIDWTTSESYIRGAKTVAFIQLLNEISFKLGSFSEADRKRIRAELHHAQYDMGDDVDAAIAYLKGVMRNLPEPEVRELVYPMEDRDRWYSDSNYQTTGGTLVYMSPEHYLSLVRPLEIDEASQDNIDDLAKMMKRGRELDPLKIYADGEEDGRHRAHAAIAVGIKKVPVIVWKDVPVENPARARKNPLAAHAAEYVHFSSRPQPPEISVRSQNFMGGGGPRGIYAYPLDARAFGYAADRPYAFRMVPTVPVLRSDTYTKAELERDLAKLAALVDISRPLRLYDKYKSEIPMWTLPFNKLWYVLSRLPNPDDDHPPSGTGTGFANPMLGRDMLLELGYTVIEDRNGVFYGGAEPEQAVFLTERSFIATPMEPDMPQNKHYRRGAVPNPTPWVTGLLASSYEQLEHMVPAKWLPKISKVRARGTVFTGKLEEFGCGAYGCVLPTLDPGVVLKVTSDESEAEFAKTLAKRLPTPICTTYYEVADLHGAKRKGNKVYLLWREEASDVGKIDEVVGQHAEDAIIAQHQAAMAAYIAFQTGAGVEPIRTAMLAWRATCGAMGKVPELAFVAEGLLRAEAEAGIFISDTHGGNLGVVTRNGKKVWAITDPGNVVVTRRQR